MKKILLPVMLLSIFVLQGCLKVETKEYKFKVRKDGSGSAVIRYINIMTDSKDSADVVESDYRSLIDSYLNGTEPTKDFTGIKNIKKRLFEEDNHLVGELTFDFNDLRDLKFYKYKNDGPWLFMPGGNIQKNMFDQETFFSSNGEWAGENVPVIIWSGDTREFEFKTTLHTPDDNTMSLLEIWKKNDGR